MRSVHGEWLDFTNTHVQNTSVQLIAFCHHFFHIDHGYMGSSGRGCGGSYKVRAESNDKFHSTTNLDTGGSEMADSD